MSSVADPHRDVELQGTYAGIVTRLSGFAIDAAVVLAVFAVAGQGFDYLMTAVLGADVRLRDAPWLSRARVGGMGVLLLRVLPRRGRTHARHGDRRSAGREPRWRRPDRPARRSSACSSRRSASWSSSPASG